MGILRFVLAALVIVAHLGGRPFVSHFGIYAVLGFYVVSGYLITAVLNEAYRGRSAAFWINRLLRLYPVYFLVAAATLVGFLIWPEQMAAFHDPWGIRTRPVDFIGNLMLFPFSFYDRTFRIVPPTWSVAVELVNYFLLWVCIARGRTVAWLFFGASVAWHAYLVASGAGLAPRYFPWYSATLFFSSGALIYFYRDWFAAHRQVLILAAPLAVLNLMAAPVLFEGSYKAVAGFYVNGMLACLMTGALATIKQRWLDKALGDLSYPMFLVHWFIGFIVATLTPSVGVRGYWLLAVSLPLVLLASYGLAIVSRRTTDRLRDVIRGGRLPDTALKSAST